MSGSWCRRPARGTVVGRGDALPAAGPFPPRRGSPPMLRTSPRLALAAALLSVLCAPPASGGDPNPAISNRYLTGWELAGPIPEDAAPPADAPPPDPADGPLVVGDESRSPGSSREVGMIDFRLDLPDAEGATEAVAYAVTTFEAAGRPGDAGPGLRRPGRRLAQRGTGAPRQNARLPGPAGSRPGAGRPAGRAEHAGVAGAPGAERVGGRRPPAAGRVLRGRRDRHGRRRTGPADFAAMLVWPGGSASVSDDAAESLPVLVAELLGDAGAVLKTVETDGGRPARSRFGYRIYGDRPGREPTAVRLSYGGEGTGVKAFSKDRPARRGRRGGRFAAARSRRSGRRRRDRRGDRRPAARTPASGSATGPLEPGAAGDDGLIKSEPAAALPAPVSSPPRIISPRN